MGEGSEYFGSTSIQNIAAANTVIITPTPCNNYPPPLGNGWKIITLSEVINAIITVTNKIPSRANIIVLFKKLDWLRLIRGEENMIYGTVTEGGSHKFS